MQDVRELRDEFAALTPTAAEWIVSRELRLIWIDCLSKLFRDTVPTSAAPTTIA
jgi:hypothetical protein